MDLFGSKDHDAKHDEIERRLRELAEQMAQLTIELGEARADISRLQVQLDSKVDVPDPDSLDADLADAKAKLGAAKAASAEAWSELYPQLVKSLAKVRRSIDSAGAQESGPDAS